MWMLIVKFVVTAGVITAVSEVAKHNDRWGAVIAALPLVTLMVMIWMRVEGQPDEKLANHAYYTFWYVLPTLPMFLLMPWMLNRGCGLAWSLLAGVALTAVCFVITALTMKRFGVMLMG